MLNDIDGHGERNSFQSTNMYMILKWNNLRIFEEWVKLKF